MTYAFSLNFLLKCIQGRRHYRFTEFACACNVHSTPHSRLYVPSEKKSKRRKIMIPAHTFFGFLFDIQFEHFNFAQCLTRSEYCSLFFTWSVYYEIVSFSTSLNFSAKYRTYLVTQNFYLHTNKILMKAFKSKIVIW